MSEDWASYTDAELAVYAKTGSPLAYREFLRRYKTPIYRLILHHIGDADEALDLTQEAFVAGFAAIGRYDGDRSFRTWMGRIALNKCRDWARRRKVRAFFSGALPIDKALNVASPQPLPDEEVGDRREAQRVREGMARLPANLREVLVLRAIDELSQSETADMLGVSEKTVETRLYRARLRLKEILHGV